MFVELSKAYIGFGMMGIKPRSADYIKLLTHREYPEVNMKKKLLWYKISNYKMILMAFFYGSSSYKTSSKKKNDFKDMKFSMHE